MRGADALNWEFLEDGSWRGGEQEATALFTSRSAGYARKGAPHTYTDTLCPCTSLIAAARAWRGRYCSLLGALRAGGACDDVTDVPDGAGLEEALGEVAWGVQWRFVALMGVGGSAFWMRC